LELDLSGGWRASATGTFGREKVSYSQVLCDFEVCTGGGQGFYRNRERSAELDADGGLFRLPGGSAKLALGAGYRTIGFRRDNGPGSSVNTDHDQDSYYAFSEVNLPLVGPSQGLRWLYRVNASAALRYERYPGVGAVATPKMGLVIAPTADFDLKASWGRSFRAPTLYQQYQPNAVYVYAPLALGASAPPAGATALLIFGGNTNLRPERATSWSATIDLHPRVLAGSKISVSYFDVRYRDRIVTPITFVSQALSNPIYRDQVTPNPSAAVQQALIANAGAFANFAGVPYDPSRVIAIVNDGAVNAGSQKAHGIDILADYRWRVARAGEIRATANTSYLVSTQQLSASQPVTDLAGLLFNPPHWRGQGALSWISGPITLTGNVNYTGGVTDARQLLHAHVRSMTTFDLTGIYKATAGHGVLSGVNLIVSAQNLFNAKPDRIAIEGGYDAPYDSTNYSPVGRLLSIGIAKTW
jgi:outer membrane receptor protein involved in Fe transport